MPEIDDGLLPYYWSIVGKVITLNAIIFFFYYYN